VNCFLRVPLDYITFITKCPFLNIKPFPGIANHDYIHRSLSYDVYVLLQVWETTFGCVCNYVAMDRSTVTDVCFFTREIKIGDAVTQQR
jgi:hypothetical protein